MSEHGPAAHVDHHAPSARPASFSRVSLAITAHSTHANLLGNVHGGEIMKLADNTAGAVAFRHSGGPAVTAAMDEMSFLEPVRVGDIIRTFGQVNWSGRSSMEIGVRVEAQPWGNATDEPVHVASAYFVFVAIDEHGAPRPPSSRRPPTTYAASARPRSAAPTASHARGRSTRAASRDGEPTADLTARRTRLWRV
ncbi:acyl-CoA thioesterase [Nocardioides gansuensis]|uniref:acyl-CoA thioesterase n=1 Tax=Nocardioides gansuensis TaxID=2138300 RepID=UPI001FE9F341|nr:acyl-CoA thioesterase [Nocardioides gansuensis]